jgi:hypothetical protein
MFVKTLAIGLVSVAAMVGALSPAGLEDPVGFAENRCPQSVAKCLKDSPCSQEFHGVLIGGLNPISPAAQGLQQCVSSALFSLRNVLGQPGGGKEDRERAPRVRRQLVVVDVSDGQQTQTSASGHGSGSPGLQPHSSKCTSSRVARAHHYYYLQTSAHSTLHNTYTGISHPTSHPCCQHVNGRQYRSAATLVSLSAAQV